MSTQWPWHGTKVVHLEDGAHRPWDENGSFSVLASWWYAIRTGSPLTSECLYESLHEWKDVVCDCHCLFVWVCFSLHEFLSIFRGSVFVSVCIDFWFYGCGIMSVWVYLSTSDFMNVFVCLCVCVCVCVCVNCQIHIGIPNKRAGGFKKKLITNTSLNSPFL